MRKPLLLLVALALPALAKPRSYEPSIKAGGITFEVQKRDLTARKGERVLWKHTEDPAFHYRNLQVEGNHVVVSGVLDETPFHPQVVVLDLEGHEVARIDGRFLVAEGEHFYVDQLFPKKRHDGLPDIDMVHLNARTRGQKVWNVKAPSIPEPCLSGVEEPYPVHLFLRKAGEEWQFRYFTGTCEVLGTFQEGVFQFRVQEVVEVEPDESSRNHIPFFTYPLLVLPVWMMRRGGWLWAAVVALVMAFATWGAAYFQLWFYPPFLFPLMIWALITLLVSLWRTWRRQPVNRWLTGAALSTWITFICLWIRVTPLNCRGQWWC